MRLLLLTFLTLSLAGCCSSNVHTGDPTAGDELDPVLGCVTDDDCVITCDRPDDCCGQGCECTNIYSRTYHQEILDWQSESCHGSWTEDGCPVYDCGYPEFDYSVECECNVCTLVSTPTDEWQGRE